MRVPLSVLSALLVAVSACGGSDGPGSPTGTAAPGAAPSRAPAPPAAGPDDLFVDRAAEVGLDFVHVNGMSGQYYFNEMMGSGAALFDYDGDGDLDAYLVQGHALGEEAGAGGAPAPEDRLFRNDLTVHPDGSRTLAFTDVTEASGLAARGYGMGVATGDYDGDGHPDLYVTNDGPNQLWRNRGDGTFEEVTATAGVGDGRWSVPALFFDYDADGRLDLFVGNYVDFSLATHKRCTTELGEPNYCGPLAYKPLPDALFHNSGDGTFEEVTGRAGLSGEDGGALGAVAADFNADGREDLYVGNDGTPNQLWINRGDGTFENQALLAGVAVNADGAAEASMGVDAADFDGDGDEDLFLTHLTRETNTLYTNHGDGVFDDSSGTSGLAMPSFESTGFGTAWFDYDNDGLLDLAAVNGAVRVIPELALAGDPFPLHQPNQLFHQTSRGFEDVSGRAGAAFAASEVSRGAAFGDVDNDGDIDILLSNNNGPARLLVNRVGQDRGWLGVRLTGGAAGRDMLGAWAGLEVPGGAILWRRVKTAGSYASAGDPRLLFGLGEGAPPETGYGLRVRWPDGSRETFEGLPPGAYTTLRQGEGRPGW